MELSEHVSTEVADAHLADGQASQRQRHIRLSGLRRRCVVFRQVPASRVHVCRRVSGQSTRQVVWIKRVAHETEVLEIVGERTERIVFYDSQLSLGQVQHVERHAS